MKLKEIFQTAWKNKGTILEGFYNAYVSASEDVKREAMARLEICRSNKCGLYNPKGENNDKLKAVFPGKESCGGCGCDLYAKAHAMSAHCFLKDMQANLFKAMLLDGKVTGVTLTPEQIQQVQEFPNEQVWDMMVELETKGEIPEIEPRPLWDAVMTHEQEMEINKIAYQKQFERRNNG